MLDGLGSFFSSVGSGISTSAGAIGSGLKSAGGLVVDGAKGAGGAISGTIENLNLGENAGAIIPILQGAGIIKSETVVPHQTQIAEPVAAERGFNVTPGSVLPWVLVAGGAALGFVVIKKVLK